MDESTLRVQATRASSADAPGPTIPSNPPPLTPVSGSLQGTRMEHAIDEVVIPPSDRHLIIMNIGRPYRLEETLGGRVALTSGLRGDIAVIPAGHEATFRTRGHTPQHMESVAMLLDPTIIAGLAVAGDLDPSRLEMIGTLGARDPAIERIATSLLAEMETGGMLGELYVESLATALGVQLLRKHSSLRQDAEQPTKTSGRLSRTQLRRVVDFVEDNLDRRLTLETLATVAGLSPYHFARLFKNATGRPPHRYVVERRVERAKVLLTSTDLPLHEVAASAGFADQSHLARHIRHQLGVTPTALRRS